MGIVRGIIPIAGCITTSIFRLVNYSNAAMQQSLQMREHWPLPGWPETFINNDSSIELLWCSREVPEYVSTQILRSHHCVFSCTQNDLPCLLRSYFGDSWVIFLQVKALYRPYRDWVPPKRFTHRCCCSLSAREWGWKSSIKFRRYSNISSQLFDQ